MTLQNTLICMSQVPQRALPSRSQDEQWLYLIMEYLPGGDVMVSAKSCLLWRAITMHACAPPHQDELSFLFAADLACLISHDSFTFCIQSCPLPLNASDNTSIFVCVFTDAVDAKGYTICGRDTLLYCRDHPCT